MLVVVESLYPVAAACFPNSRQSLRARILQGREDLGADCRFVPIWCLHAWFLHAGLLHVWRRLLRRRRSAAIAAAVLAEFGRANADTLRPLQPVDDNARMLRELTAHRRQLVERCVANQSQREHVTLKSVRTSTDRTIKHQRGMRKRLNYLTSLLSDKPAASQSANPSGGAK